MRPTRVVLGRPAKFLGHGENQQKKNTCEFWLGFRRRTNVQQLTCKIDLSISFYYLFFSFVLLELKPFVFKGKSWGKNYEKM